MTTEAEQVEAARQQALEKLRRRLNLARRAFRPPPKPEDAL